MPCALTALAPPGPLLPKPPTQTPRRRLLETGATPVHVPHIRVLLLQPPWSSGCSCPHLRALSTALPNLGRAWLLFWEEPRTLPVTSALSQSSLCPSTSFCSYAGLGAAFSEKPLLTMWTRPASLSCAPGPALVPWLRWVGIVELAGSGLCPRPFPHPPCW